MVQAYQPRSWAHVIQFDDKSSCDYRSIPGYSLLELHRRNQRAGGLDMKP